MQRREKYFKNIIFVFFIIFFVWTLIQFLTPFTISKGSVNNLSGSILILDNEEIFKDMIFPTAFVYTAGDILCHQKPERSFFINENQMPFCSRCTAIWLGFCVGLGFMVFFMVQLDEKFLLLVILSLIPIGVDGVGQLLGYWESTNIMRLITGLLIGVVSGVALGVIFDEIKSLNVLKKIKK